MPFFFVVEEATSGIDLPSGWLQPRLERTLVVGVVIPVVKSAITEAAGRRAALPSRPHDGLCRLSCPRTDAAAARFSVCRPAFHRSGPMLAPTSVVCATTRRTLMRIALTLSASAEAFSPSDAGLCNPGFLFELRLVCNDVHHDRRRLREHAQVLRPRGGFRSETSRAHWLWQSPARMAIGSYDSTP